MCMAQVLRFVAVYGGSWYDYLNSLRFTGICYDGCVNYAIRDSVIRVAVELIRKRFGEVIRSSQGESKQQRF